MIEIPIMTVTKIIVAPHPCTSPQGGDREMLAALEMVYRGPCRLLQLQLQS
jgi:hypothetical protein